MKKTANYPFFTVLAAVAIGLCVFAGCNGSYSDQWLYSSEVSSVYVKMFENKTFRRNLEYTLTDALVKKIEADSPYKVVSDRSKADSVIYGEIVDISETVLSGEIQTGRPLEMQVTAVAKVNWKNLKTGRFIVKDAQIKASQSFSEFQNQRLDYAKSVSANKLAERIVEAMELNW